MRTLMGMLLLIAIATTADQIMLQGRFTAKILDDLKYQGYRVRAEVKQALSGIRH